MPRVMHFEIGAEDPERAAKFYTTVFGWEIKKWDGKGKSGGPDYWTVTTGPKDQPGINGGLMKRPMPPGGEGYPTAFVCTIVVSALANFIQRVIENDGSIHVPKMEVPGVGWLVYCKDTEGNLFGMLEPSGEMR